MTQLNSFDDRCRYGFSTEKDYNDSEAYCGGWNRQHQRNGGKCGVCGDAWDLPQVSSHTPF